MGLIKTSFDRVHRAGPIVNQRGRRSVEPNCSCTAPDTYIGISLLYGTCIFVCVRLYSKSSLLDRAHVIFSFPAECSLDKRRALNGSPLATKKRKPFSSDHNNRPRRENREIARRKTSYSLCCIRPVRQCSTCSNGFYINILAMNASANARTITWLTLPTLIPK